MLSFNCGLDGNGIVSMYGIYKILSSRKSPRVVVYDLHELFDIQTNDNSKYLASLKMAYDHDCIDSIFWDISPNERIKMRSNLYRYNSMLLPILSDYFSPHETYNYGYSPLKGTMKYVKKNNDRRLIDKFDCTKKKYFEKLISSCRENSSELLCIISPRYKGEQSKFKIITEFMENKGIHVFNFLNLLDDNPSLFHDAGHLNEKGAIVYSSYVAKKLKEYLYDREH